MPSTYAYTSRKSRQICVIDTAFCPLRLTPTLSCTRARHAGLPRHDGCRARRRSRRKRDAAGVTQCSWFSPARERPACLLERGVRRRGFLELSFWVFLHVANHVFAGFFGVEEI